MLVAAGGAEAKKRDKPDRWSRGSDNDFSSGSNSGSGGGNAFGSSSQGQSSQSQSNTQNQSSQGQPSSQSNSQTQSGSTNGGSQQKESDKDKENSKSAKNNKDDDDDDNTNSRGSGKSNGKDQVGKELPPQTVVEMLKRWFGDQSAGQSAPGGKPQARSEGDTGRRDKDPKGRPVESADSGKSGRKSVEELKPVKSAPPLQPGQLKQASQRLRNPSQVWQREMRGNDLFRRDELLVVNAVPAAMEQLQFAHVETIIASGSAVSRFIVPPGLDAISARQLLQAEMPNLLSAFNYVYRPYVASMEGGGLAPGPGQAIRPFPGQGCASERCYGPALVNWVEDPTACTVEIDVGVIDTGFDSEHPTFKDRKINWSTVLEGENVPAQTWHGTGVLAVLSGSPQSSTPGLIPDARITATNTFYADSGGQPATDTTTLIKALRLMETRKVKVINLSLAGPQDAVLHKQIKEMSAHGVLFVAAAGNGGPLALPSYPAAYSEVIAVTAVDRNMMGYRHATRGPHIDLAAPGVDVWTALPDRKEGLQTGTSFAVPYVTAAAAAIYPKDELIYRGRPLDPKRAVLGRLTTRDLGPAGRDSIYGQGLLQAPAKCAGKPGRGAPIEVSSAWAPVLQPVAQQPDALPSPGLMSLTPSAEVKWPGVVQHLSFQPAN